MKMAEEVLGTTEEATPEEATQLDTTEPTTEKSLSDYVGDMFEEGQEADDSPKEADVVSDEAETADEGNVDEEAKPKVVVLTRREKEALKHADMEEAVEGMDPSAVKTFAKKLADERSAKDKAMSEKGKLQEQLEAKELAESEEFDIDSDENEWMPEEAKEAFKGMQAQLKANQEALETLKQGSDHTVERFWDKIDTKQYPQYSEGDDAGELRSEIEGDADAFMTAQPGITRAEALTKCLKLATIDDQVKAEVAKAVAKKTRKIRGGVTPKMSGGQRLPATGTETMEETVGAMYDELRA
jgi:hypothetical protein